MDGDELVEVLSIRRHEQTDARMVPQEAEASDPNAEGLGRGQGKAHDHDRGNPRLKALSCAELDALLHNIPSMS